MPSSFKVLGQSQLSTSAYGTLLYTVPSIPDLGLGASPGFQSVIGSIVICNQSGGALSYYLRVVPDGETAGVEHVIFNSVSLDSNGTSVISLGLTMETGDVLEGYASGTVMSVSVFGVETF